MSLEKYFENSEILKKIIKFKNFNSFYIKKIWKMRQSDMNYKFLEFFLEFESNSILRFLDENSMAPFLTKPKSTTVSLRKRNFYVLRSKHKPSEEIN